MTIKNRDNIHSVTKIEAKIADIFDVFRRELSGSYDYDLILLLLSLYKDNQICKDFLLKRGMNESSQLVSDNTFLYQKAQRDYQPIIDAFSSALEQMSQVGFHEIIDLLFEIDKMTLKKNFRVIFENTLYQIVSSQGRLGMPIQPIELTRFIYSLVTLPDNSKVFNPFAGLASFAVCLDKSQRYFGLEVNRKTWALGVLRLMAHGKLENSSYMCDDAMLNWPEYSNKFDLIVAHPPFNHRINDRSLVRELGLNVRTTEQFLIKKSVDSLNKQGKLIAILPIGFLFKRGIEMQLREHLINEDLIDTIISLPGGLLPNTSIPLAILVIDKNKNTPRKVRFVDAENYVETISVRRKVLDYKKLTKLIQGGFQDGDSVKIIDNDQIKASDYNLNVPRYFVDKDIEGVKLGDILEPVKGHRKDLPTSGKFIRIRDLKGDNLDFNLDVLNVEEKEFGRHRVRLINESCLLLAAIWSALKPTYFEYSDTPVFITSNILAFKVDEKIADTAYLINELHANYVKEQLAAYSEGATISRIRRDDLLNIIIKLPSLEEQRAKVQGLLEISDKIKEYKKQRDDLALGIDNKSYESFASIKHSLGKPLISIGSALRNIEHTLFNLHPEWEKIKLDENFDISLRDTFDSMNSSLNLISTILKNNDSEIDLSKKPMSEIDFLKFIRQFVNNIRASLQENIDVKLVVHSDIKQELNNRVMLNGNIELLDIAFNNIVDNAERHGFIDASKRYKLEFNVSLAYGVDLQKNTSKVNREFSSLLRKSNVFVKIDVSNNGYPFPENYTLEKLVRKNSYAGVTGNSGQGGYELNEIIKYHNDNRKSTLELITNDHSSEYTTIYSFLLPLNI